MGQLLAIIISTTIVLTAAVALADETPQPAADTPPETIYGFEVKTIDGETIKLDKYAGDVCLIVNVASRCGLTQTNYNQLEPLFQKYKDQGFRILAFPANDFLGQEPGTEAQIKEFCTSKYHVTFDLFSKIHVSGKEADPLYIYLTSHPDKAIAGPVQWNFQKYLVDRTGHVIAKFGPRTEPNAEKLVAALEKALAEKKPEKDADDAPDADAAE